MKENSYGADITTTFLTKVYGIKLTMKEVIIMSVIVFATVMSFFIRTDNDDEDRQ